MNAIKYLKNNGVCLFCGGNDSDMPCAYPSGGKSGCIRDARLALESTAAIEPVASNGALPPLPEPWITDLSRGVPEDSRRHYAEDQMIDYAREAQALAAVDPMAEQNQTGAANLKKVRSNAGPGPDEMYIGGRLIESLPLPRYEYVAHALAAKPAPSGQSDEISRSQAAAQTVDESPQTRMNAHFKPLVMLGAKPAPDPSEWQSSTQCVMPDGSVRIRMHAMPGAKPAPTMTRDEAHAMVHTGRPAADLIREAHALGLAQSTAIPKGWKLVPLIISDSMFDVALKWGTKRSEWEELIAAAPNPPVGDWTLVRTAAEDAVIVAIEAMVDQQLTASAMSPGDMFRLDGADIWNAAMAAA